MKFLKLRKKLDSVFARAEIKGYTKARKEFDKKIKLQEEAYKRLLKEKNKILDEQIKFSESKRSQITLQIEKEYNSEIKLITKRNDKTIENKNIEINNLYDKIEELNIKYIKDMELSKKESEKYIEAKDKEFNQRETELLKSEEFIQNFFITLLGAIEKVKEKTSRVSVSTYRHDNSLKELAQQSMRISNIILEMGRHNQDLIKLTDTLSDISIKFDKQSTKLSVLNKIRAKQ